MRRRRRRENCRLVFCVLEDEADDGVDVADGLIKPVIIIMRHVKFVVYLYLRRRNLQQINRGLRLLFL